MSAGVVVALSVGACAKTTSTSSSSPTPAPTAASSAAAVHTANNAKLGTILVDGAGKTLYYFDRDSAGAIACTGACATRWPPLLTSSSQAPAGVQGLGTAKRPDGGTQITYKDHPLYRYSGDPKPGDTNGDGFAGVWHAAKVT